MFVINGDDWRLLQAAKATGMTVEKLNELDDPAPLPLDDYDGRTTCGLLEED